MLIKFDASGSGDSFYAVYADNHLIGSACRQGTRSLLRELGWRRQALPRAFILDMFRRQYAPPPGKEIFYLSLWRRPASYAGQAPCWFAISHRGVALSVQAWQMEKYAWVDQPRGYQGWVIPLLDVIDSKPSYWGEELDDYYAMEVPRKWDPRVRRTYYQTMRLMK